MQAVLACSLVALLGSVVALPTDTQILQSLRSKKSAGDEHVTFFLPTPGTSAHLREDEHKDINLEHSARSYYESPLAGLSGAPAAAASSISAAVSGAAPALSGLSLAPVGSSGPAVGVFPHARIGGCAIPLLLSCAPNVVAGQLAKSHGYAAPSYRMPETVAESNTHQLVSEDLPEHLGNERGAFMGGPMSHHPLDHHGHHELMHHGGMHLDEAMHHGGMHLDETMHHDHLNHPMGYMHGPHNMHSHHDMQDMHHHMH